MAAEQSSNIYFDLAIYGTSENSIVGEGFMPADYLLNFDGVVGGTIGGEYVNGSFKTVLAYSYNAFENTSYTPDLPLIPPGTEKSKFDFAAGITTAKFGYKLINTENFTLWGVAGYLGLEVKDIDYSSGHLNYENDGPMAGIDLNWKVNDKLEITANYARTFNGNASMEFLDVDLPAMFGGATVADQSSSLSEYRIKAIYMFWENVGLSLSYAGLNSTLKYTYTGAGGTEKIEDEATYSGWALGVVKKF